jgi:hypothetical protein
MLWVACIAATIQGLILAFTASLLLGVLVLVIEPLPLVLGVAYWFWGIDLAQRFMESL